MKLRKIIKKINNKVLTLPTYKPEEVNFTARDNEGLLLFDQDSLYTYQDYGTVVHRGFFFPCRLPKRFRALFPHGKLPSVKKIQAALDYKNIQAQCLVEGSVAGRIRVLLANGRHAIIVFDTK